MLRPKQPMKLAARPVKLADKSKPVKLPERPVRSTSAFKDEPDTEEDDVSEGTEETEEPKTALTKTLEKKSGLVRLASVPMQLRSVEDVGVAEEILLNAFLQGKIPADAYKKACEGLAKSAVRLLAKHKIDKNARPGGDLWQPPEPGQGPHQVFAHPVPTGKREIQ